MPTRSATLVLAAVAYAPKVVTIWEGFKEYFIRHHLPFDYILYSNYETQVEALMAGQCDIAWNSPLAWVRAERLARAQGTQVRAIAMRDTDCDLTSVIIVRADSPIRAPADLKGNVIAVGAIDSPQATLIPFNYLRTEGLTPGVDFEVQRHDLLGGIHRGRELRGCGACVTADLRGPHTGVARDVGGHASGEVDGHGHRRVLQLGVEAFGVVVFVGSLAAVIFVRTEPSAAAVGAGAVAALRVPVGFGRAVGTWLPHSRPSCSNSGSTSAWARHSSASPWPTSLGWRFLMRWRG